MIGAVSSVNFCSNTSAAQPQRDPFSRPGKYTIPEVEVKPKKKKGGFWRGLGKLILTAAVVAGLLVAGNKTGVLKVLEKDVLKDASIFKKAGHYMSVAGKYIADFAVKNWQKLVKACSKKPTATI